MTFEREGVAEKAGKASRELAPASPKVPASLAHSFAALKTRLLVPFILISLLLMI